MSGQPETAAPECESDPDANVETLVTLPGGWFLAQSDSKKDGGRIAILGIPVACGLAIVDLDGRNGNLTPECLGYAVTPRSRHLYVDGDDLLSRAGGDALYESRSQERGWYSERLFSPDGTPRELPVVLGNDPRMSRHRAAFGELQAEARGMGLDRPAPIVVSP